ncbi:hypothetical protein [Phormidesmis priestleyi]|nr:hypothetical protein [Phormidesmis priestleyi]
MRVLFDTNVLLDALPALTRLLTLIEICSVDRRVLEQAIALR